MNIEEVYNVAFVLDRKIDRINSQLEHIKLKREALKELCTHDIVVKYHDDFPRKISYSSTCYCPACGKLIKCCYQGQEKETDFKKSRVIDLKNISLIGADDVHMAIKQEIISKLDLYYDECVPIETLASMMEMSLLDIQTKYDASSAILRRTRK